MSTKKTDGGRYDTLPAAAEALGISDFALKLYSLAGCPGGEELVLRVNSAADLAREFAIKRSTVSDWQKQDGFPQADAEGAFDVGAVRRWRVALPHAPTTMTAGTNAIENQRPTGDLVRVIFRWIRCELAAATIWVVSEIVEESARDATPEEKREMEEGLTAILTKHTGTFVLTDADVEKLLVDCCHLI